MKELEKRIFVNDEILLNEYSYMYGDKRDELVNFVYYNWKKEREGKVIQFTYSYALALARSRRGDGRYKNYEFLIYV